MPFTIRPMTPHDLTQGHALSQQLGWSNRLEDWQEAFRLGQGLVMVEAGKVVATALYWCWGPRAASIGLVIVNEALRGQGLGKALFKALMEKLEGYSVRLHATPEGRSLYEKFGFEVTGYVYQYQGALTMTTPCLPRAGTRLRPGHVADITALAALDYQASGMQRDALIAGLLRESALRVLEDEQGAMLGFAVLRRFGRGYMLGPLVCPHPEDARALCSALFADIGHTFVRLDSQGEINDWLAAQGLALVDRPTAMVRGMRWQPARDAPQSFALVTQAMG
ncbi:GNAT family N-acetyltransferase [Enterobacteriaceae bacterium 4M9]|nr:GNAT family N-acetyltransferase [Enterobacteriaceae bacterium 4M9]